MFVIKSAHWADASVSTAADESLDISFTGTRNSWDSFVTRINNALNPLDLEFASSHDQDTGEEVYAVVRLSLIRVKRTHSLNYCGSRSTGEETKQHRSELITRRLKLHSLKQWWVLRIALSRFLS